MNLSDLSCCPSTLKSGFITYSPVARLNLFGSRSKNISHQLQFDSPGINEETTSEYNEKRKTISLSGVQEKYSLVQDKNELKLTSEKGTHILKPVPLERLARVQDMPANEHLTMQIAFQVYGIKTASNGMIFFKDEAPAYLTRRFDYKKDGSKYQVEDFATLMGKSPEKEGEDYKYNASYLDIALLINKYVPAAKVEMINFFRILIFNYLFANGDAHLKNFSLMESDQGDYILAPAYDLLCTSLHINDQDLALHDGLYEGDYKESSYQHFGYYTRNSFLVFAEKIGIKKTIAEKIIESSIQLIEPAKDLVEQSFLSKTSREKYVEILEERQRRFTF